MKTKDILKSSAALDFSYWMLEQNLSIGITTDGPNDLFLVGRQSDGNLSIFERKIDGCRNLWSNGQTLWISSRYHLWQFENCLDLDQTASGCDRMYVPQHGYSTGELGINDIAVEAHGRVVFVNSLNSCLATISEVHRFIPLWRPSFISQMADDDRCHLSGLVLERGYVKYVSAFGRSDESHGWRKRVRDGGCIIDVESHDIVATGLSMPHSPRIYGNNLWLLNSGTGHFGFIDLATGRFEKVMYCRGFLQGLSFHGNYAIVGLSKFSNNATTAPVDFRDSWIESERSSQSEILVIDMVRGTIAHRFAPDRVICNVNDIVVLPGVASPGIVRPQALGFKLDQTDHPLLIGPYSPL